MSITFTSGLSKPSAILDKPSNLERPAFGTLYGFDASQEVPTNAFPVIEVYDTEAEVLALTSEPDYTIVHAKDTDNLYVWDGTLWFIYNND